jgi:endonuclease III
MQRKERYEKFISHFKAQAPNAETELHYNNPYELLVAVILSAQCTDKRVNMTTPALFKRHPTPYELAKAEVEEVFQYIKSISFPNNKAKHLVGMATILINDFGGEVPSGVEDLQKMPGVGRKTANVISSVIFHQPAMAVDTHVFRVSKRLGLVTQTASTPLAVEKQLTKYIPSEYVHVAHHWLILHGRYVCVARNPKCEECKISSFCWYYGKGK